MSASFDEIVTIATNAFLVSMRREFMRKHPDAECPVLNLEEYTRQDQRRLKISIARAIEAAKPENVGRQQRLDSGL